MDTANRLTILTSILKTILSLAKNESNSAASTTSLMPEVQDSATAKQSAVLHCPALPGDVLSALAVHCSLNIGEAALAAAFSRPLLFKASAHKAVSTKCALLAPKSLTPP